MKIILNFLLPFCTSLLLFVKSFFVKLIGVLDTVIRYTVERISGIVMSISIHTFFESHYRNFLFVMLCNYDLGPVRFVIVQWFSCILFLLCCVEAPFVYGDILEFITNSCYNIYMSSNLPLDPGSPTDSTPEIFNTDLSKDDLGGGDSSKAPKRSYISGCALIILYVGFCIANSGG